MIDVHLIGYTADLEHLVFDLEPDGAGRYRLVIDGDLLATLYEIRERRAAAGMHWPGEDVGSATDDAAELADEPDLEVEDLEPEDPEREPEGPDPEPEDPEPEDPEPEAAAREQAAPEEPETPDPTRVRSGSEPGAPTSEDDGGSASSSARRGVALPRKEQVGAGHEAKLSPAQIQSLLRSGRSPTSVAKQAGTDVAWIERWLPPILEERARVLREAQRCRIERPRLGPSRDALGEAVRKHLRDRKVEPDDVTWDTSRRADGAWRVSVRYRHRGKQRTASWRYEPREGALRPSSDLARDLGWTGKRKRRTGTS